MSRATPLAPSPPFGSIQRAPHPAWLLGGVWLLHCSWSFAVWGNWYAENGIEISVLRLACLAIFDWVFWIVGSPAVWWIARAFPPINARRFLILHFPLSVVCALAAIGLSAVVRSALEPISLSPIAQIHGRIGSELGWYVVFYWLVVCSYLALDYHAAYQRKLSDSFALEVSNLQLGKELAESRLANLRHQLHPHFLFNSLHSVSALMDESVETAREKLVKLSAMLRMSLEISQRDEHCVCDEVRWIEDYLALEEIRHRPRVSWQVMCNPQAHDFSVPCLITQPLVENAIKHSKRTVATKSGRAIEVKVSFAWDGENLHICVEDNGPGWPLTQVFDGIGLSYVRRVLAPFDDAKSRLRFGVSASGGARVCVVIPGRLSSEASNAA